MALPPELPQLETWRTSLSKAISFPSGDQAGSPSCSGRRETRDRSRCLEAPVRNSTSISQRSARWRDLGVTRVNAIALLSGAQTGS